MPGLTVTRFTAAAASVAACAATLLVASSSPVEAVPGLAGRSYVSVSVTPAPARYFPAGSKATARTP